MCTRKLGSTEVRCTVPFRSALCEKIVSIGVDSIFITDVFACQVATASHPLGLTLEPKNLSWVLSQNSIF